jgi:prophage DNA circulation protein
MEYIVEAGKYIIETQGMISFFAFLLVVYVLRGQGNTKAQLKQNSDISRGYNETSIKMLETQQALIENERAGREQLQDIIENERAAREQLQDIVVALKQSNDHQGRMLDVLAQQVMNTSKIEDNILSGITDFRTAIISEATRISDESKRGHQEIVGAVSETNKVINVMHTDIDKIKTDLASMQDAVSDISDRLRDGLPLDDESKTIIKTFIQCAKDLETQLKKTTQEMEQVNPPAIQIKHRKIAGDDK